jgi:hypothetical protein
MIPWWTGPEAGLFGGIAGSALGLLGALIGTIGGLCAPRGKCKRLVYGLVAVMISIGIIALAMSVAALFQHQPFFVFYPLILCGSMSVIVGGGLIPLFGRVYREVDNRRFEAEELRRS